MALRSAEDDRGALCARCSSSADDASAATPSASVSRRVSGAPADPLATTDARAEPRGRVPSEASARPGAAEADTESAGEEAESAAGRADPPRPGWSPISKRVAASSAWSRVRQTASPSRTRDRSTAPRPKRTTTAAPAHGAGGRVVQSVDCAPLLALLPHAAAAAVEDHPVAALDADGEPHHHLALATPHVHHLSHQHPAVSWGSSPHKPLVPDALQKARGEPVVIGVLAPREDLPQRSHQRLALRRRQSAGHRLGAG
eukprot:scaffold587_cov109-Isochrysis_galbana.AAC.1